VLALPHQDLEGRDRVRVLRIDGERRGVLVERAIDLAGALLEHRREGVVQRRPGARWTSLGGDVCARKARSRSGHRSACA